MWQHGADKLRTPNALIPSRNDSVFQKFRKHGATCSLHVLYMLHIVTSYVAQVAQVAQHVVRVLFLHLPVGASPGGHKPWPVAAAAGLAATLSLGAAPLHPRVSQFSFGQFRINISQKEK